MTKSSTFVSLNRNIMNARQELEGALRGRAEMLCATISHGSHGEFRLPVGYTEKMLDVFMESLDFNYDNRYGGQELYGTVWLKDGKSWLERGEYDGSEWWNFKRTPEIPGELL